MDYWFLEKIFTAEIRKIMPGFRGHLLGGGVVYLVILQCIKMMHPPVSLLISGFIFCMIGSLFPDIDIKSKGQKLFYYAVLLILATFLWCKRIDLFIGLSLLAIVPLLVKHRGLFHQLWFLIFLSMTSGLAIGACYAKLSGWAMHNALFFLAGAVSHIVLDKMITKFKYWLSA